MARKYQSTSAIVSVSIVLFMLALYGLLYLHAANISGLIKEKINIVVELNPDTSDRDIEQLKQKLLANQKIKKGSIAYYPKEAAIEMLGKEVASFISEGDNPFMDIVTFNIVAKEYTEENIQKIAQVIENEEIVGNVFTENETIKALKNNIQRISFLALIIGLILVVFAFAIVYNTLKLKLYADRMEIKTMQLVGAKSGFIARPYVQEATKVAFHSFLFVSGLVGMVVLYLKLGTNLSDIINPFYVAIVLLTTFLVGMILTVGIARYVVRTYLSKERDQLY